MFRPEGWELAALLVLVACAGGSAWLARERPALYPTAAAMLALAAIDVLRLWTRASRWDVALVCVWPAVCVAPMVATARRTQVQNIPEVCAGRPGPPLWLAVLVLFGWYGEALSIWGHHLRAFWPAPLRWPWAAATVPAALVLALLRRRPSSSQNSASAGSVVPPARPGGWFLRAPLTRAEVASLVLAASIPADLVTWVAGAPRDVGRQLWIVVYLVQVGAMGWARREPKSTS